jgi:hypothetical protein
MAFFGGFRRDWAVLKRVHRLREEPCWRGPFNGEREPLGAPVAWILE